ncbi:MAG: biotin--[acetyl-CoA-carboxylase] ligase, partial [Chitinivibrionales bacterium]|nr:biotin--[acetyl-CoA-carboxylase] ligase [Chitinivibrionales bacterium]
VVADHQTQGRGRMSRSWISPPGTNILCSIIFYPDLDASSVYRLTMMASVCVVHAVEKICGQSARIKWPNDIYIYDKKVCGILTEFLADFDRVLHAVVGIGINVNFITGKEPELKDIAVSLCEITGKRVSRIGILKQVLKEMDDHYPLIKKSGFLQVKELWEQYSLVLNRRVTVVSGDEKISGTVKGLTENGHLLIADKAGNEQEILCGDVSLHL